MRELGRLARFRGYKPDPTASVGLKADHPAVVEGRTLFPGSVVGTFQSRRFLVSGDNSSKIGKIIEKGPWAGMPTYTLTLEERATCPRSCHVYRECFGNAMQWARRNDAFDPDFIAALKAEVITLVREVCAPNHMKPNHRPPRGIVIRLHVLGDFFSVAYVKAWGELLAAMPEVHVFGYTARGMFQPDGDMSIATAIRDLNQRYPDRWVIRWSSDMPGPGHTIVVDEDPQRPDVVVCPAETEKTETCSTCAMCWSPAAWPKTIAFIRHGMRRTRAARKKPRSGALHNLLVELMDADGLVKDMPYEALGRRLELSAPTARVLLLELVDQRMVQVVRKGAPRRGPIFRVFASPQAEFPPLPALPAPTRSVLRELPKGRDPVPKNDAEPVRPRKPDEPLMPARPHAHGKGGWGQKQIGTAHEYDIGTPEERIAKIDPEELKKIAARYGAEVKKKEGP